VPSEREIRSRPSVVMFSPRDPGERAKEGYFEDGEARWEKREESIMCTCRGDEVGAVAQLRRSVFDIRE
jgi:hypothetical protein